MEVVSVSAVQDTLLASKRARPTVKINAKLNNLAESDSLNVNSSAKASKGRSKSVTSNVKKTTKTRKTTTSLPRTKDHYLQSNLDQFVVRQTARLLTKAINQDKELNVVKSLRDNVEKNMKVVMTEEKGRGVIATKFFDEGDFVVEYAGELVPFKEAKKREEEYKKDENIGSYMFYFVHSGTKLCVDATAESGRYGRLLNHSRGNPNCHLRVIPIDDVPRLAIVAKKRIEAGEELVYDYGDRDKDSLIAHPWLKY